MLVILKAQFSVKEAAILKAENPKAKLVDRNGFNLTIWAGKGVKAADTDKADKLTPYMLKQAIEAGAKPA